MTKAEMNYKRDYGHKDSEELALNAPFPVK